MKMDLENRSRRLSKSIFFLTFHQLNLNFQVEVDFLTKPRLFPQCVAYENGLHRYIIGFQLLIECLLLINMSISKWKFRSNEPLMMMVIRFLRGSPTIFELVSLLIFPVNFDCLIF